MALLTETAGVADDLGIVPGLGTVAREVTKFTAVVAGDVCSRTRLGALARHVAFTVAVLADNDRLLGAFRLVVTVEVLSET